MKKDITIIGSGPGGYVAAIRAAQMGADVALLEKDKIGGVCLNVGCIPTKALFKSALFVQDLKHSSELGVELEGYKINYSKIAERKNKIVGRLTGGVQQLLKKNGVEVIKCTGKILGENEVGIEANGTNDRITSKNIIIATGSTFIIPRIKGVENEGVLTSTELLDLKELPPSIAIIGGGVIGIEFASILSSLGSKVYVMEKMPSILPNFDREISEAMKSEMAKKGIVVNTDTELLEIRRADGKLHLKTGSEEIVVDKVLMSIGRRPVLPEISASLKLKILPNGAIEVNNCMKTCIPNIYAIGDVNGNHQLAHVASAEGIVAVNNIMGKMDKMNYRAIPGVVYGLPEIASVGLTEEEARRKTAIKVGKFPYSANGKALCMNEGTGFFKVIADEKWKEILGVHIFGYDASNMIAEAGLAINLEATAEEICNTVHAHPTISEIMMEACEEIGFKAIHM